jgi:aquaporin Z
MKPLTEFVGSMLFMLAIPLAVAGAGALAPLAIGSALMVMVYMGGHVSGAHYNPAVSLAVLIRGKMTGKEFLPYVVAQVLGAVAAFGIGRWVTAGKTVAIAPGAGVGAPEALAVEVLFTFMLALVVLNVATTKATSGNSFYGLAIGFTIVAAAFAGGPISGGAFNPAVAIGAAIIDGGFSNLWIYLVGTLLGGALAGAFFKVQHPEEFAPAREMGERAPASARS